MKPDSILIEQLNVLYVFSTAMQDFTVFPDTFFKVTETLDTVFWLSVTYTEIFILLLSSAVIELGLAEKFEIFGGVVSIVVVVLVLVVVLEVVVDELSSSESGRTEGQLETVIEVPYE